MEAAGLESSTKEYLARDVQRAALGDVEAFERLYRRHVSRIHSLARRMLGEREADDATQEVFIRAWRRLATYRGRAAFGTWLGRLALNLLLDRRRGLALTERRFGGSAEVSEESVVPVMPVVAIDCESALPRLPEGARVVLVMHDVEGYTHEEIAGILCISVGTSKSQLHRGRALLRGLLADGDEKEKR